MSGTRLAATVLLALAVVMCTMQAARADIDLNAILAVEKTIDGIVDDLQWVGDDRKTVFLRTQFNTLFRSKTEGRQWTNEMTQLEGSDEAQGNGRGSGVVDIIPSPVDKNRLFLLGAGQVHWTTRDLGETYEQLKTEVDIHEIRFHPTEADWFLASRLTPACFKAPSEPAGKKKKSKPVTGECFTEVYLSQDYGKTMKLINSYVVQFGWGAVDQFSATTIFMTEYSTKKGAQNYGIWDADVNFSRSDDLWAHSATNIPHGNRFLMMGDYLFVAMVPDGNGADAEVSLQISHNNGQSFALANVPSKLSEHSYTIVDTSEGTVFLHINHGAFESQYGQLYVSDASGVNYVKSLGNALRNRAGRVDLEKVQAVEGIYIANYVDNTADLERAMNDDSKKVPKRIVRTAITFDKGGEWHHLMPPAKDINGDPITCVWKNKAKGSECTLHLHGVTDKWGPFYSVPSAIGIVMATGNTGPQLLDRADEMSTYLSRDAGLTWEEIMKGSHIYDIGDHGGLIVMAKNTEATDTLYFSWDQGKTPFIAYQFTKKAMEIDNIIIEPTSTSLVFLVYGTRANGQESVVAHLDFTNVQQRTCKGESTPDDDDSDYELWSPHDGRIAGGRCLMGRRTDYVRRKRQAQCFNGAEKEFKHNPTNCECIAEDWECDFGYSRPFGDNTAECKLMKGAEPPLTFDQQCAKAASGTKVFETKGYRRVAGDTCEGGYAEVAPREYTCPSFLMSLLTGRGLSFGGVGVLFVMSLIVIGLAGVTYMSRDSILRAAKALPIFQSFKYKDLNFRPDTAAGDDEYFDDEETEDAHMIHDPPNLLDAYTDNRDDFGKRSYDNQAVPILPSPANKNV